MWQEKLQLCNSPLYYIVYYLTRIYIYLSSVNQITKFCFSFSIGVESRSLSLKKNSEMCVISHWYNYIPHLKNTGSNLGKVSFGSALKTYGNYFYSDFYLELGSSVNLGRKDVLLGLGLILQMKDPKDLDILMSHTSILEDIYSHLIQAVQQAYIR